MKTEDSLCFASVVVSQLLLEMVKYFAHSTYLLLLFEGDK